MTVREALYISMQHSGSDRVDLHLQISGDGDVTISVTDEGCGFVSSSIDMGKTGHYGLVGMRERMQRLGGRFELITEVGAGTTVRLLLHRAKGRMRAQRD